MALSMSSAIAPKAHRCDVEFECKNFGWILLCLMLLKVPAILCCEVLRVLKASKIGPLGEIGGFQQEPQLQAEPEPQGKQPSSGWGAGAERAWAWR